MRSRSVLAVSVGSVCILLDLLVLHFRGVPGLLIAAWFVVVMVLVSGVLARRTPSGRFLGSTTTAVAAVFVLTFGWDLHSRFIDNWSTFADWPVFVQQRVSRSDIAMSYWLAFAGLSLFFAPFIYLRRRRGVDSGHRDPNQPVEWLPAILLAGIVARAYTVFVLTEGVRIRASGPVDSLIVYIGLWTPLVAAGALLALGDGSRQRRRRRDLLALGCLVAYALLGVRAESKSAALSGLVVWLTARALAGRPVKVRGRAGLLLVGITLLTLVSFSAASSRRDANNPGTDHGIPSALTGIHRRLGGVEYAAPVLAARRLGESQDGALGPDVTAKVYGLPRDAATAFGTTAWAVYYWQGGWLRVVESTLLLGVVFETAEALLARRATIWARGTVAVLPIVAFLLLFDGNLRGGQLQLMFLGVQWALLEFMPRFRLRRPVAIAR